MRVLFWGTAAFALPSLRVLAEAGHEIAGVVTQPDRPAGRGRKLRPSPVKQAALENGIPVFTPRLPRAASFLDRMGELRPELSVVAAYGHILSREALDLPSLGSVNVHPSLLPELRGAAPVHWAIARGYRTTGVTIMRMNEGMDAGPILHQEAVRLLPGETGSELYQRLAEVGAEALARTLGRMSRGEVVARPQDHARATFAPKLSRARARLRWERPAEEVACWMRALDAVPGAWSELDGKPVKLFRPALRRGRARREPAGDQAPGTVIAADRERGLRVVAGEGWVSVGEVQPAGKRRMPAADWIRGRGIHEGQRFR